MNSNKFFEGDKVQVIIKTSEDMTQTVMAEIKKLTRDNFAIVEFLEGINKNISKVVSINNLKALEFFNYCPWTDWYPYELIERKSKTVAVIRRLEYRALPDSDYYGDQKYSYYHNEDARTLVVHKCRGSFVWKCGKMKFYPSDAPYAYRDPNF